MPSHPFTVRKAGNTEAAEAFRLIEEYCTEIDVVVRDSPAELEHYLKGKQSGIWLAWPDARAGAEVPQDTTAIGCIVLRPLPQFEKACEIKRLYVQQLYRGVGIAKAMLLALEEYAAAQGFETLYLDTKQDLQAAVRFYEGSGYRHCERYNDNPQATIFMQKRLR